MKFLNVAVRVKEFLESPIGFNRRPPQPKNFSGRTFPFLPGSIPVLTQPSLNQEHKNIPERNGFLEIRLTHNQRVGGSSPSGPTHPPKKQFRWRSFLLFVHAMQ